MTAPDQSRPNPDKEYVDMKYIEEHGYSYVGLKRNANDEPIFKIYFKVVCLRCSGDMIRDEKGKHYCTKCDSYTRRFPTKRVRMWDSE